MELYVKKCKAVNPSIHLQDWRTIHLCRKLYFDLCIISKSSCSILKSV